MGDIFHVFLLLCILKTANCQSTDPLLGANNENAIPDNSQTKPVAQVFSKPGIGTVHLDSFHKKTQYIIVASKIIRPNTFYQVLVSLLEESVPTKVLATISRNNVPLSNNEEDISPLQSLDILLKVPPNNAAPEDVYKLHIEGYKKGEGRDALVFNHDEILTFDQQFLSIIISTNRVIFTGSQIVRIRVVMLTTQVKPYEGIVDLFILDPDGYIVRKWNSKELNVGVLSEKFELPEFPKVGFWKIRVTAEGQTEELMFKVEKHYFPLYELVVSMPMFILDTDEAIEASVDGTYLTERLAAGNIILRWFAKKIDHHTPMYNDTVYYREEHKYYQRVFNTYHHNLYYDGNRTDMETLNATNPYIDPFLSGPYAPKRPVLEEWTYIRTDTYTFRQGDLAEPFIMYLTDIEAVMGQLSGIQVRADAVLTEFFYNDTQRAFAETRIIREKLRLEFLGTQPFSVKPEMLFEGQVSIMFVDQIPLIPDYLEDSLLQINFTALLRNGTYQELPHIEIKPVVDDDDDRYLDNVEQYYEEVAQDGSFKEFRRTGVYAFRIEVPENTDKLKINAYFYNADFGDTTAETLAHVAHSSSNYFIDIRSSSKELNVGSYAVFHVKTSFPFYYFDWIIMSKDIIWNTGREFGENIHPELKTFSVVVSSEMTPGFHIIVYAAVGTGPTKEIVADTIFLPVDDIKSHSIDLQLNQVKDHLKNTVEVTCRGDPGANFLVSTMRIFNHPAQGINFLTKPLLLKRLHSFEKDKRHIRKISTTSRGGETPDRIKYYPSFSNDHDAKRVFETRNLIMFSNIAILSEDELSIECDDLKGEFPCIVRGCYTESQICDKVIDCVEDGLDESNCPDPDEVLLEEITMYRLSRQSRFDDFYDKDDGDWGYFDTNIDEDREQFIELQVPETPDEFYFYYFSISKDKGITVLELPETYSTTKPVDFYCEAPEQIHRGECPSIRCIVLNRTPVDLEAVVVLHGSEDFSFIHVEEYGYVASYAPRISQGNHHHFVWLRPEAQTEVLMPISPHIELGSFDITLELSSQITSVEVTLTIEVLPEGSLVHRHTSLLLDLRNRAHVIRFLNIIVDETPIIPYEVYRRFVSGSPIAHVVLSGDAIGPVFPDEEPVRLETMFPSVHGRVTKGAEYHTFNLAANTWQLHYLRLTNQLVGKNLELARKVFDAINVEYLAIMRRFRTTGGLSNFDTSQPSVWLTAWAIRLLSHVKFQDWEDYVYIDPLVTVSGILWILNFQSAEGYFIESLDVPIHKAMSLSNTNVTLTAHVLITLEETSPILQGSEKMYLSSAKQRALGYLERNLPEITDGYELAITTYALALAKSSDADLAYGRLLGSAKENDGLVYWGRSTITTNRVRYEFNRPFLEAKDYQDDDALAVEATGYALITLFLMEGGGITVIQEKTVEWLNTMRFGDGGFISTVDTIVALQALVLYSYHSRIKDITDLSIEVEFPDSNISENFIITGEEIAEIQRVDVTNVWGHMNLYAKGAGQAVAQLDLTYGIDYEPFKDQPPRDCFNLTIDEFFHGRNKSEITIKSCFSWTLTGESNTSGEAMLIIDIPTGYWIEQPVADAIVRSRIVPEMRDADVLKWGKTIWYFDSVPTAKRCFDHTVRRYFPVANLTRTRQAVILEAMRPERFFVRTFNATSLYILSVCEVCGSYQCPYCPTFSAASPVLSEMTLVAATALAFLLVANAHIWLLDVRFYRKT